MYEPCAASIPRVERTVPCYKVTRQEEEPNMSLTSVLSLSFPPPCVCEHTRVCEYPVSTPASSIFRMRPGPLPATPTRHRAWCLLGAQYVFVECVPELVAHFSLSGVSKHRFYCIWLSQVQIHLCFAGGR